MYTKLKQRYSFWVFSMPAFISSFRVFGNLKGCVLISKNETQTRYCYKYLLAYDHLDVYNYTWLQFTQMVAINNYSPQPDISTLANPKANSLVVSKLMLQPTNRNRHITRLVHDAPAGLPSWQNHNIC